MSSLVAIYASRFRSCRCADRNRVGGVRSGELKAEGVTRRREVHAAQMALEASAGYFKRFSAARASAICGSLAVECSKWPRNSW